MTRRIALVVAAGLALGAAASASAEEIRAQLNPGMILNMLARPIESPEAAFNAALRSDPGPVKTVRPDGGEVLPDGSVRYGKNLTVTVRNPCPPGDLEHEASLYRPLPGRARR